MNTKELLLEYYNSYPLLYPEDIFKFIYQSSFGCEHMVSSLEASTSYIKKEAKEMGENFSPLIEKLDGGFSRINLNYLKKGLSAETLGKLFFISSKESYKNIPEFERRLNVSIELVQNDFFGFSKEDFFEKLRIWKENGYPPIHHSERYRKEYSPAYRVISDRFVPFLPLFSKIDEKLLQERTILSIEGSSASGKSTLSSILEDIYNCNVFHTDDFFLQKHQRTKERLAEAGGNLDRERFLSEVITPMKESKAVHYRKYSCSSFKILPPITVLPSALTVVEGVYSMHPYFSNYYNLSVFLDISHEKQKERIKSRNSPPLQDRFFNEWIPMENNYFDFFDIKSKCDLIIKI